MKKELRKKFLYTLAATLTLGMLEGGCTPNSIDSTNPNPMIDEQQINNEEGYFAILSGGMPNSDGNLQVSRNETVPKYAMAYVTPGSEKVFILKGTTVITTTTDFLTFRGITLAKLNAGYTITEKIQNLKKVGSKDTVTVQPGTPITMLHEGGGAYNDGRIYDIGLLPINGETVPVEVPRSVSKNPSNEENNNLLAENDLNVAIVESGTEITYKYIGDTETTKGDKAFFSIKNEDDDKMYLIGRDGSEIPIDEERIIQYSSIEEATRFAIDYEER